MESEKSVKKTGDASSSLDQQSNSGDFSDYFFRWRSIHIPTFALSPISTKNSFSLFPANTTKMTPLNYF